MMPPRALLVALASQAPLIAAGWPLRPTVAQIATGGVLTAAGLVLNVWSERLFVREGVGVCPFTPAPVVIERGPYRLTRNPMYLGLIALNLAFTFFTGVMANLWSSVAYAMWLHYAFVLPEENFLRASWGDAYTRYALRVPRWITLRR